MLKRLIASGLSVLLLTTGTLAQDTPKPAKLMTLAPEQKALTREFYGQITPNSTVDLSFQTSGRI